MIIRITTIPTWLQSESSSLGRVFPTRETDEPRSGLCSRPPGETRVLLTRLTRCEQLAFFPLGCRR